VFTSSRQPLNLVAQPKMLPTQQGDGHVSVLPQIVVECSQVKSVSLMETSVGEELDDLELADLMSNRLARDEAKKTASCRAVPRSIGTIFSR
jgi:hypothetical protein